MSRQQEICVPVMDFSFDGGDLATISSTIGCRRPFHELRWKLTRARLEEEVLEQRCRPLTLMGGRS